jgi:hypothetical protein
MLRIPGADTGIKHFTPIGAMALFWWTLFQQQTKNHLFSPYLHC